MGRTCIRPDVNKIGVYIFSFGIPKEMCYLEDENVDICFLVHFNDAS
jgi:hypothetical protein